MGVNAQTTVPKFTAGQVLTAAQQTAINTGIPVFATTTTRDAAFGGSNKVLAEGQMAYIENIAGSSAVQYYDGAAWATLVGGGLNYISGASFSAVSTLSLPDNTFSATYRNYRIIMDVTSGSTDINVRLRLRAAGSDLTSSLYNDGYIGRGNSGGTLGINDLNQNSANAGLGISSGGVNSAYLIIDIIGPQLADKTYMTINTSYQITSAGEIYFGFGGALYNATTVADSMTFLTSTGNITGVYRVYGYVD